MTQAEIDRTPERRQALVDALSGPSAYPHPVTARVRVIETHVSHLFLTGEFAYKVKKPVELGFLDFSTLEKRRAATTAELELNRRLSPDVYAGIVEVRRGPDGALAVEGPGEVEEYALKMRQLDEQSSFDRRVLSGAVGSSEVERVAAFIAGFHLSAVHVDPATRYGRATTVAKHVDDNLAVVEPWAGRLSLGDQLRAIAAYSRAGNDALASVFEARRAAGFVRDCHGDLHAGNIFLGTPKDPAAILVIDRIEFNDRYRYIDVAADLAFLTMDLRSIGRDDLAAALVTSYLSLTSDHGLAAVLPFYEVYRAMVRCKVAVLQHAQLEEGSSRAPHDGGRHAETARKYASLAARLVAAQRPTGLFIVVGATGSGKSSVARELGRRWGVSHIASDVVRKTLFGVRPDRPSEVGVRDALYSKSMSIRTYREMVRQGERLIASGRPAILDATFLRREHRRKAREAGLRHGVPVYLIECRLDERTAIDRLEKRYAAGTSESDAGPELLARHRSTWEEIRPGEADLHVVVDTSESLSHAVDLLELSLWRHSLSAGTRATISRTKPNGP